MYINTRCIRLKTHNISTEKSDSITKRELANDKLNEREMIKQVCDNPFLMNNNYLGLKNYL